MPSSSSRRVVLFDADGVLVDSHHGYRSVGDRWSALHGLDPVAVLAATPARRPVDTIAEVAPHLDPDEEHARLVELVAALPDAFPVFPDAAPLPAVLVDGRSVARGKPDPEGYLLAADVVVGSLTEVQPLLLRWVGRTAARA